MSTRLDEVMAAITADFEPAVDRLKELLRIPSISTDPAFHGDCLRAAEWCAGQLEAIGFLACVHETPGKPMVVATWSPKEDAGLPHVLYYGHYDVQPPDPLEEWDSDPFDPVEIDAEHGRRIVARGAVDDKGQLMTFVEAFRTWMAVHGDLPIRVTVLLEGEEESGSPSLDPFLEAHREELVADVCMISDTGMWDIETPTVTYMLRGLVYVEATLHGPGHDLHSGMYGGAVVNPNNALARILGQLHDAHGVVQIPGFYDEVQPLSPEEAAEWDSLSFDESAFLASAGLEHAFGEEGHSTLERTWSRPTCDINGMWGGYTGDGAKTVIPAHAQAKISCRLVADQDPEKIHAALIGFLEDRTPAGCRWSFTRFGCDPAIRVSTDSIYLQAARKGLEQVFSRETVCIGCGGSIPVVGSIQRILGYESLLVGFGLLDDRVHSPNEKFEVRCFELGIRSHAAMLGEFARLSPGLPDGA